MLLQLAFDNIGIMKAKVILYELENVIDIVEIGTPFIIEHGVGVVQEIKSIFPKLTLLADLKIMDAGEYESDLAFQAGADIVTILAAAEDSTIQGAIKQARKYGKRVMADMIGIRDIEKRVRELDGMGVDYICAHTGVDEQDQGKNPLTNLRRIKNSTQNAGVAVAGGIGLKNLDGILDEYPDIVIVGSGITSQADRKTTAKSIKERMDAKKGQKQDGQKRLDGWEEEKQMKVMEYFNSIVCELHNIPDENLFIRAEQLSDLILNANKVFVLGAGRSGFMVKSFAMRLGHMGIESYVIGETTTPAMDEKDILIIGSGSGETDSVVAIAAKARKLNGKIVLFTINPNSSIARMADMVIPIKAVSPKIENAGNNSIQPGASLFEIGLLITLESVVIRLMEKVGENSGKMFIRHANLE